MTKSEISPSSQTVKYAVGSWQAKKAGFKGHFPECALFVQISMETACEAFFDPFVFSVEEAVHPEERRDAIIGMTINWRLVYVVYELEDDVIRIISARLVTKRERIQYEDR